MKFMYSSPAEHHKYLILSFDMYLTSLDDQIYRSVWRPILSCPRFKHSRFNSMCRGWFMPQSANTRRCFLVLLYVQYKCVSHVFLGWAIPTGKKDLQKSSNILSSFFKLNLWFPKWRSLRQGHLWVWTRSLLKNLAPVPKKTTFLIPYSSENILDQKSNNLPNPIASMYGIFTHIYY